MKIERKNNKIGYIYFIVILGYTVEKKIKYVAPCINNGPSLFQATYRQGIFDMCMTYIGRLFIEHQMPSYALPLAPQKKEKKN